MILKLPGRTGLRQMYIIELLSEMVYKVYKSSRNKPASIGAKIIICSCYAPTISEHRGVERDFARIRPSDIGASGLRKSFCQNKPR